MKMNVFPQRDIRHPKRYQCNLQPALRTLCDVDFPPPVEGETLETHTPNFWRRLDWAVPAAT